MDGVPSAYFCLPSLSPESFTARAQIVLFGRRRFRLHGVNKPRPQQPVPALLANSLPPESASRTCLVSVLCPRAHDAPSSVSRDRGQPLHGVLPGLCREQLNLQTSASPTPRHLTGHGQHGPPHLPDRTAPPSPASERAETRVRGIPLRPCSAIASDPFLSARPPCPEAGLSWGLMGAGWAGRGSLSLCPIHTEPGQPHLHV